jgi:hypothetical protein
MSVAALLLQTTLAALGLYASALGFLALWFWQCAAQGRDPWLEPNPKPRSFL